MGSLMPGRTSNWCLASYNGCGMTRRQAELLLAHVDADQIVPQDSGYARRTSRSLCERGWLRPESMGTMTTLTQRGRKAVARAAEGLARLAAPPLVPVISNQQTETVVA
jgi:hypothetical protein